MDMGDEFDDLLQWLGPALEGVGEDLLFPGQSTQMPDYLSSQFEPSRAAAQCPRTLATAEAKGSAPSAPTRQEQAFSSQPSGSSKARRKRPPTTQQQAAELEKQIAVQTTLLQQLSINNVYLTERVRMLEMVISVRDAHVARVQEIREGLKFNPFASMGHTVEETVKATPGWMASQVMEVTSRVAVILAPLLPHFQRHPHLIWGPDKHTKWHTKSDVFQHSRPTPPSHAAAPPANGSASNGVPAPDAAVLAALQGLVTQMDDMQMACKYIFWLKPQLLLASSVHMHAIDPHQHTQWDQLVTSVRTAHAQGGATPTTPPVAPESHWKGVAQSLMLSDYQKLQASVLWDLISSATASVVAHRASLGAAMAKLQQDKPPPAATDPGSSLNVAATSQASDGSSTGQLSGSASIGMASATSSASIASIGSFDRMQQEEAIMKKLQLTLVKQGCLVILGAEASTHILSPLQWAMVIVGSYPFLPDDMALLHAVATECTPLVLGRLCAASTSA